MKKRNGIPGQQIPENIQYKPCERQSLYNDHKQKGKFESKSTRTGVESYRIKNKQCELFIIIDHAHGNNIMEIRPSYEKKLPN